MFAEDLSQRVRPAALARTAAFIALVLVSGFVYWSSLTELFQLAWKNQNYSHILVIVPISLCLLAFDNNSGTAPRTSWKAGCVLLLCAGGMTIWSAGLPIGPRLCVTTLSLVTFWMGSFVLCFGLPLFQALRFPLLFLFLMVPLPGFLVEKMIYFLQSGSTEVAYSLFRLFGVPVAQSGFVLSLPGINIEIAEECSGIRSSTVLLITGLALAHLYVKSGWRQALVCLCVVPLALFKNGLRVFVLSTLAVYADPAWLEGRLHRSGGVLFFALALTVVVALIAWLRRLEGSAERSLRKS